MRAEIKQIARDEITVNEMLTGLDSRDHYKDKSKAAEFPS